MWPGWHVVDHAWAVSSLGTTSGPMYGPGPACGKGGFFLLKIMRRYERSDAVGDIDTDIGIDGDLVAACRKSSGKEEI